jgi:anthranilate synthase/aminodeoxychorismate synthase-like glutamine amidotransferase
LVPGAAVFDPALAVLVEVVVLAAGDAVDDELLLVLLVPPPHAARPIDSASAPPQCLQCIVPPWFLGAGQPGRFRRGGQVALPFLAVRVLVIDNYDSFTYNLVQYLGELGAVIEVVRNDHATVDDLLVRGYDRLIVSPGPCTPNEAGISVEAVRRFPEAGVPTLGVCLGHQALVQAWGGTVIQHEPVHGKTTMIEHDRRTIFRTLRWPLKVGRYHSLVAAPELPECLERSAFGGEVVMAVRHRSLPLEGVQFHPESVLTEQGRELLGNFLERAR